MEPLAEVIGFDTFELLLHDMTEDELRFARDRHRRFRRHALVQFTAFWIRNRLGVLAALVVGFGTIVGFAFLLEKLPGPSFMGAAAGGVATIIMAAWLTRHSAKRASRVHPWRTQERAARADIAMHSRTLRQIREHLLHPEPDA